MVLLTDLMKKGSDVIFFEGFNIQFIWLAHLKKNKKK